MRIEFCSAWHLNGKEEVVIDDPFSSIDIPAIPLKFSEDNTIFVAVFWEGLAESDIAELKIVTPSGWTTVAQLGQLKRHLLVQATFINLANFAFRQLGSYHFTVRSSAGTVSAELTLGTR